MSDQVIERRKTPPLSLLVTVFVVTTVVSGVVIYVVLKNFIVPSNDTTSYTTVLMAERGAAGVRVIDPPREVMDFTLTTHAGDELSLSALRGQHVVLYFGYTHCPDVCPLTLMDLQQARELLGEDAADDVAYVFVSVDPERDTAERLARYFEMRNFDFLTGMVGEETTLRRITPDYNLIFQKNDDVQENGYYTVDHTASLFLIDPEGRLTRIFAFGTEPEVIAQTIAEGL